MFLHASCLEVALAYLAKYLSQGKLFQTKLRRGIKHFMFSLSPSHECCEFRENYTKHEQTWQNCYAMQKIPNSFSSSFITILFEF
jgi:hypothetical protein